MEIRKMGLKMFVNLLNYIKLIILHLIIQYEVTFSELTIKC